MTDVTGLDDVERLLAVGDLDDLVRTVDLLARREEWDTVVAVRDRCRAAAEEIGRQLWGVAQFADYRIALAAPASLAASVVIPGSGRFALGPLTEVLAQAHTYAELDAHLDDAVRPVVAQERVLRGEDLTAVFGDADVDDLPAWVLQPWEPQYPLPRYRADDRLDGDPGTLATRDDVRLTAGAETRPMVDEAHRAAIEHELGTLVGTWVAESQGEVRVAAVDGAAEDALAAVGIDEAELLRVRMTDAMRFMAAAGASGGYRGRRRGGAAGRRAAWWVGAALAGLDTLEDPDELEFRLENLTWWVVGPDAPSGVRLGLLVEATETGWCAVVDARDTLETDEPDEPDPEE